MTGLSKILVVFVTFASLAFMAFAGAMRLGGKNWDQEASKPALAKAVAFEVSETGTHTAKMRVSGESIGSSLNQAEVVIKAQQKVLSDLRQRQTDIGDRVQRFETQRDEVKRLVEVDRKGVQAQFDAWGQQLKQLSDEVNRLTEEVTAKGLTVASIRQDLAERRYEIQRLQNQLELLRDDVFFSEQQRDALQNELVLLRESRQRMERRQAQLKAQIQGSSYE